MVCPIGSGKMAAMARVLASVNFSQSITEEVGSQKLTAKYIEREFREADEANLLDEEDMHVYDLMPLTDPLQLVCCNACKKPIKISQYAAHTEICKSLRIAEEMVSELNGGTGHKKRAKKQRKKSTATYDSTLCEKQERCKSAEANKKRNLSCLVEAPSVDDLGVSPGIAGNSTDALPPPTKCSKLILSGAVDKSDHLRTAIGVAKSSCLNSEATYTYIPAPLGTKVFYSLRNHRLRSAVKCMYYESFSEELSHDLHVNAPKRDDMELQDPFPTNSHGEKKAQMEQGEKQPSTLGTCPRKPEQVLSSCSDVYSGKLMDTSNQDPVNSSLSSQATPMENMRNNYLPQSFSFSENTGSSLGTMQQSKGRVPVT